MKFNILYTDNPWRYENKNTGGSGKSGSAAKYATLSIRHLRALPVADIMERNSVCFMWATTPLLPVALEVLARWEYKYKTMITWRKIMSLGMGWWFRGQTEHLLLGIRGKVKAFRCQLPNFYQCKALAHSRKPIYFRDLIERATAGMPGPRRLELFATEDVPGWTCLGREVDGRDIRESLQSILHED